IASGDSVQIGAFDAEGGIATPTPQKLASPAVAAVVGTLANGEIVYGNADQLVVAHAKAGAITVDPALKIETAQAAYDLDARAAVLYKAGGKTYGRILKPGNDEPASELDSVAVGAMCLTRDRAWLSAPETLVGFGGSKPVTSVPSQFNQLLGCT